MAAGSEQMFLSPIPRYCLDTDGLSLKQAIDVWHEQVALMGRTRLKDVPAEKFHSRIEYYQLADLVLGRAKTYAQSFDRSRYQIGRDGIAHYVLQLYLDGGCRARTSGQEALAARGDLMTFDCAQPQMTETPDYTCLHLFVPRPLLAPLLKWNDEQNMRVFDGNGALVGIFRDHLHSLYRRAPFLTVREAENLVRPTLELAAAVINGSVGEETIRGVELALFERICRHIDERIQDPALTTENLSGHFKISPRKLSYLFQNVGGVATYIQERRLHHARNVLGDPAQMAKSIGDIALTYGFIHPHSFTRAFQRVHGMSPREFRSLAFEGRARAMNDASAHTWWRWMTTNRL